MPIFDELADPKVVSGLAAEAEQAGWHGVFVWDHLRWREPVRQVADPWITLAAVATATERLRLGPMVTPLPRRRPALGILAAAWSGAPVHHHGEHYTVDGIEFLPKPAQRHGVPVWAAGFPGNLRPLRRAARLDGFFPVNLTHPDQLAEVAATIAELRGPAAAGYDIAVALPPGTDPAPYATAGATWWLTDFAPETVSLDEVRGVLRDGPPEPAVSCPPQ